MKKILFSSIVVLLGCSLLLFLGNTPEVFAGTTGKVSGTILDSGSNEALPGVNVMIEETTLGAATDGQGYYFILNVPPGTYNLKVSIVGYAVETISNVRIFVDRTTTQDVALKTQAVAGEEVTVTAKRVPVPLDVSQTEAYIDGEEIALSPAGRFDELIGYQAGVVFTEGTRMETSGGYREGNQSGKGFSVRGGAIAETDVRIDGVSMLNRESQTIAMPLSRNLIQDVQILTGGFNAEYGNISSGLINVVTKDGSYNRYSGVVEARYRPKDWKHYGINPYHPSVEWKQLRYIAENDWTWTGVTSAETYHYMNRREKNWDLYTTWRGYNDVAEKLTRQGEKHDAQFWFDYISWLNRDRPLMQAPDIMIDPSAGGPIPGIPNTKFYASFFWNRAEYMGPHLRPHSHEYNSSLKITTRIKSNMVLVIAGMNTSAFGTRSGRGRGYREDGYGLYQAFAGLSPKMTTGDDRDGFDMGYGSSGQANADARTTNVNIKFTHTYSPSTYYELAVGGKMYEYDVIHTRGTNPAIIKNITDGLTGKTYGFDEYPLGFTNQTYTNAEGWAMGRRDEMGTTHRSCPPTFDNLANDLTFRGDLVSQVNRYNQIKVGFSFWYSHNNVKISYAELNRGEPITDKPENWSKWKENPMQFEWYVQDKLEWEGMIVNFGIRGLTFMPNTKAFDVGEYNYFAYDDVGDPYWSSKVQWGGVEGEGNWMWQEFRTREVKHKVILMPRIGISHPITESSKIFFNYGHFYSMPQLGKLYAVQGTPVLGGYWGNTGALPLPDIKWPKLISYEIGYSQSIYNQFLLQLSGYYKDYTDDITGHMWSSYVGDVQSHIYQNMSYRDIRGLEARIERSFGRFINGWANYNYMITSYGLAGMHTYFQDPVKNKDAWYGSSQGKPRVLPTARFSLSLRTPVGWGPGSPILGVKPLAEWRANFLARWQEGGERLWNSGAAPKDWYYVDYRDTFMLDFYLTKRVARGASLYMQVKNLFNIKTVRSMGGSYRNSLHLWFEEGDQKGNDKIGDYKGEHIYLGRSRMYSQFSYNPRDYYMGIRYQF